MYEPRYGCLLDWVCITGEHYEGKRKKDDGANVATVYIAINGRHLILEFCRVPLRERNFPSFVWDEGLVITHLLDTPL